MHCVATRRTASNARQSAIEKERNVHTMLDIGMNPMHVLTTAEETIEAIAAICRHRGAQAWLFGSHAKGAAGSGSDIDIAIEAANFDAIEEEIDSLDTIFVIDLLDASENHLDGVDYARINLV